MFGCWGGWGATPVLVHVNQRHLSDVSIRQKGIHNKSRGGAELISGPAGGTIINDQCGWLPAGGVFTEHLPFPTSASVHRRPHSTTNQCSAYTRGEGKSLNGGPPSPPYQKAPANVLPGHIDASKRTLEYQSGGFNPGAEGCTRGEGGGGFVTPRGHRQR